MIFNFNNFILLYGAADQIGNIVGQFMIHLLITLFMICLYAKYISIPNGNIGFFLYFKNIKYGNIFQISIFFLIFSILIIFFYHTRFDTGIILSIRNYIFGIPCIYLGYKLFNNEITFNDKLLVYFVIFCFFVALIQFIFVYQYGVASLDSLPFKSKEHLGHSYYDTIYYTANSVFNSAKEYSYFILFFGMLILSKLSKYSRKNLILLVLILFFSLILSGSRTVIILFSMTVIIYLNIFKVRLTSKLYLYLLLFMLMSTIIILLANNFIVLNYLDFYFNVTYYQDYIARLMEFVDPDMFAYSSFFGNGLAVHGQEREMSNFLFITENLNDGGLTKIFIETGWLGTFFIIFHYLIILLISLLGVKKSIINKSDSLFFVSVIPILYIFLFLKAHPVHSDIFIFSSLYYSVGCSIYLLQNKVR